MTRRRWAAALVLCVLTGRAAAGAPSGHTRSFDTALEYLKTLSLPVAYQWLGDAIRDAPDDDQRATAHLLRLTCAGAESTANMLLLMRLAEAPRGIPAEFKAICDRRAKQARTRALDLGPLIAEDAEGLLAFRGDHVAFAFALDARRLGPGTVVWDETSLEVTPPQSEADLDALEQAHIAGRLGAALLLLTSGSRQDAKEADEEWERAVRGARASATPLEVDGVASAAGVFLHAGSLLRYLADMANLVRDASLRRYVSLGIACHERVLALEADPQSNTRAEAQKMLKSLRSMLERLPPPPPTTNKSPAAAGPRDAGRAAPAEPDAP